MSVSRVKTVTSQIREHYPRALMQCAPQTAVYVQCLELNDIHNLKRDVCGEQFQQLKRCFQNALRNVK